MLVGYGLLDVKRMELEKMSKGDFMCAPSRNASIMNVKTSRLVMPLTWTIILFVPDSPLFHESAKVAIC